MDLIAHAEVPAVRRRPGREPGMRRGIQALSVFVLLTTGEAREIVAKAHAAGRSVSDYTSNALTRQ